MSEPAKFLKYFVSELKARQGLPKHIEVSNIGPVFTSGIFNETGPDVISESVFTGMDFNPDTAVLKGLVEMLERKAFRQGFASGFASCKTERSDGFAAYPRGLGVDENASARSNAYHEAVERFVWAKWWDDETIGHATTVHGVDQKLPPFLEKILEIVPIQSLVEISPKILNADDAQVAIYFAFLEPFGVISGGACGAKSELDVTRFRAACELLRHAIAVRRLNESGKTPLSFYERRLAFFGCTEAGTQLVDRRIRATGVESVLLPDLAIDEPIPHAWDDLVAVHRCLFENQPPFVGGKLERLCL